MLKRRSWKLGPVDVVVVTDDEAAGGKAPEVFRHEAGSDAASDRPIHEVVATPPSRGNPRALWNQPLSRQLLAIPALVALVSVKVWGTSTWWWILLAIAVPLQVVYLRAVRRTRAGSRRRSES